MEELYLPVLSHFENENSWLASLGRMRFQISPEEGSLKAEIWEDPWCYDLSAVEEILRFPMTEEGLVALRTWLTARAEAVNARPEKSFTQSLETRKQEKQAEKSEAK